MTGVGTAEASPAAGSHGVQQRLTIFADSGRLPDVPVIVERLGTPKELATVFWRHLHGANVRYAVLREDRIVRAMYLAPDLIPNRALSTTNIELYPGAWVTTAVLLGNTHRAMSGPGVFFRQLDLGADEAWMAPVLMRFQQGIEVMDRIYADAVLHEWKLYEQTWICERKGHRWRLLGAGNTDSLRRSNVLTDSPPDSASEYLWRIGAVPLGM
jgi:hypothetical protein